MKLHSEVITLRKLKAFKNFLVDTMKELRKVHWLKPKELVKNTMIVLSFVVIFSLFFAGVDFLIDQAFSIF